MRLLLLLGSLLRLLGAVDTVVVVGAVGAVVVGAVEAVGFEISLGSSQLVVKTF